MTRKRLKITLLVLTGLILLGSFTTFTVLFFAYERGEDAHNEDALRTQAEEAMKAGDPLTASTLYQRLIALNPFEPGYEDAYRHTLMAIRDFDALAAATNHNDQVFVMTEEEKSVEAALTRGAELIACHSNDLAIATFASVTNLNAFAVTPFLIQAQAKAGKPDEALTTALGYTARFPQPGILRQAAEWSALARRRDLVEECRTRALRINGRIGLSLAHYCDALIAGLDGKLDDMTQAMNDLNGEIDTPLAKLMKLQCAANGGSAKDVENAYDEAMRGEAEDSAILPLARDSVKVFLSKNFPSKVTVDEILRLTALIDDPEHPDVDIVRLSLLAKAAKGTLLPLELEQALQRFPNDRGLLTIKRQQAAE